MKRARVDRGICPSCAGCAGPGCKIPIPTMFDFYTPRRGAAVKCLRGGIATCAAVYCVRHLMRSVRPSRVWEEVERCKI